MKIKSYSNYRCVILLAIVVLISSWNILIAQSCPPYSSKNKVRIASNQSCKRLPMNPKMNFVGYIKDEDGAPMIGAAIVLKDGYGTTTDINGRYELVIPEDYESFELTFSYLGYENQVIDFEKRELFNNKITDVKMLVANNELTEVLILGNSKITRECVIACGGVVSNKICHFSISENTSNEEIEIEEKYKTTAEIFPNPFVEQLIVKFDAPKEDIYLLRLIDTKGQLLWSKSFSWYKGIQQEELNFGHLNLTSGNYFLRIIGDGRNIHTNKMIKIN